MKTCVQCGQSASDSFCPNCGQKQDIPRLTLRTFFGDFFSRIYGLDGAFPRTVIGLFKNPGTVALEYISGIRGKYVGPVGYYFLMFAILLLLIEISGFSVSDYFPKTDDLSDSIIDETGTTRSQEAKAMAKVVQEKIHDNLQYIAVLMVPFAGFWARLWFRKSGFNLLESIVFAFFSHGQAIIFNVVGFLVFAVSGYKNSMFIVLVAAVYQLIAISLFFTQKVSFKSLIKSLCAYLLAYASFLLFTTLSISIIMILSKILD